MALLPEQIAPELLFMETKWASLVSYGLTVQALTDFLPVDATLSVSTVRSHALAIAQRCEAELSEEPLKFPIGLGESCHAGLHGVLQMPEHPATDNRGEIRLLGETAAVLLIGQEIDRQR
jgi:hypothetical protein